jgi:hypothetical protein
MLVILRGEKDWASAHTILEANGSLKLTELIGYSSLIAG